MRKIKKEGKWCRKDCPFFEKNVELYRCKRFNWPLWEYHRNVYWYRGHILYKYKANADGTFTPKKVKRKGPETGFRRCSKCLALTGQIKLEDRPGGCW